LDLHVFSPAPHTGQLVYVLISIYNLRNDGQEYIRRLKNAKDA
jgi:hypothetical protein